MGVDGCLQNLHFITFSSNNSNFRFGRQIDYYGQLKASDITTTHYTGIQNIKLHFGSVIKANAIAGAIDLRGWLGRISNVCALFQEKKRLVQGTLLVI